MKKILLCLPLLVLLLVLPVQAAQLELRGLWVSSVYNLDYPSRAGLSEAQLMEEADVIIQNAKSWGMNAIFLQVRPSADALYRSELVPWSAVVSGTQGQAPAGGFDPLAYFIEQCHAQGLELHAWLNPYRITRKAASSREEAFAQLCDSHPARELADFVVFHTDGCLYYDPGRPEVQQHLLEVTGEILKNYEVDGIHLDDYFYPGSSFADEETVALYGGDFDNAGDFRRDAVCRLIDTLHRQMEELRPAGQFGVSPAGIWATAEQMSMGVATYGSQSYFDHYADSRRWVREGMVDYIAPQIYWEIGAAAGDFSILLDWWCDTVRDTDVKLYIGLAAYKAAEAVEGTVWHGSAELQRQLEAILQSDAACGALFFRYGSLKGSDIPAALTGQMEVVAPPRESIWPEELTLALPQGNQAVLCGESLQINCTAPRYSKVTVFYGSNYQTLTSDCNGGYRGRLLAETPYEDGSYTAPALVCSEQFGILSIKLTPFTITSVKAEETVAIEDIQWSETEHGHQMEFFTKASCAAEFQLQGDVLSLTFSPCRLGVLFDDAFFDHMTVEQRKSETTYRLVLPDDGEARQCELLWAPEKITLLVRKNQPDLPEADP